MSQDKTIKDIDKQLDRKDIDPVLRKSLENKKSILTNKQIVKK